MPPDSSPEQMAKGPNPLGTLIGQYRDVARAPSARIPGGYTNTHALHLGEDVTVRYWVAHDIPLERGNPDGVSEAVVLRTMQVPHGRQYEGHEPQRSDHHRDDYQDLYVVHYGSPHVLHRQIRLGEQNILDKTKSLEVAPPEEVQYVVDELGYLLSEERARKERREAGRKTSWLGRLGLRQR